MIMNCVKIRIFKHFSFAVLISLMWGFSASVSYADDIDKSSLKIDSTVTSADGTVTKTQDRYLAYEKKTEGTGKLEDVKGGGKQLIKSRSKGLYFVKMGSSVDSSGKEGQRYGADANLMVGAEGKLGGKMTVGGQKILQMEGGMKGFVGGVLGAQSWGSWNVYGVGVKAQIKGDARYGAGGEAAANLKLTWEKIKIGGKLAGALGLGGGVGGSVTVDFSELMELNRNKVSRDRNVRLDYQRNKILRESIRTYNASPPPPVNLVDKKGVMHSPSLGKEIPQDPVFGANSTFGTFDQLGQMGAPSGGVNGRDMTISVTPGFGGNDPPPSSDSSSP